MEKIRWGIIGAGRISSWFTKGLSALDYAVRYAVASRDITRAQSFAADYGYEKAYGSYADMLSDRAVDIVYIGTPVSEHYACVKMSLEAGKHVLCEKAFTANAQQARELRDIASEKGLFLMEAMWMNCLPAVVRLREWYASGALGDIEAVHSTFYTKAASNHRLYNAAIAGGALLDLTVYPIVHASMALGYKPSLITSQAIIKDGVDETESIHLSYPSGAFATIAGGLAPERVMQLYVQGTDARVHINDRSFIEIEHIELLDRDNRIIDKLDSPFIANGYEFEAMEAMDCIRRGDLESKKIPLSETISVLKITDECRRQWGLKFDCEE